MALLVVGDEAFEVSNPQRLNFFAHQTAAFAVIFLRTHATSDGREDVVLADFGRRAHEITGHD